MSELQKPWKPGATLANLRLRASLNRSIRAFFSAREVLEVEVPILAATGVSDPYIQSIEVENPALGYLQSSPEYLMKRLLAAGCGDCYYLGKAFRKGECGARHNPEFTLLEWYRLGFDDHRLMGDVAELLQVLCADNSPTWDTPQFFTYKQLFEQAFGHNPHQVSEQCLRALVKQELDMGFEPDDKSTCFDLLMTHVIEPVLPGGLVFVHGYPKCQSAMARIVEDESGDAVARRFEVYIGRIELANGYWELSDSKEQLARFEQDRLRRKELGLPPMEIDSRVLDALRAGLPDCAGVALGVDRLLMSLSGAESLDQVLAFAFPRA